MEPDRSFSTQMLANPRIVKPHPLTEFFPVTTAAKHFHQISGQEEKQADRPGQVVNESDHERAGRRKRTSVAPYALRRMMSQPGASVSTSSGIFSRTKIPSSTRRERSESLLRSFSVNFSPASVFS